MKAVSNKLKVVSSLVHAGLAVVWMLAVASFAPAASQAIGDLTLQHTLTLTGDVTPSTITSDQNDYAPASFSTAMNLRLSTDATRNVTGLAGGAAGRTLLVQNVGSFSLVLKNQSSSSSAANRFAIGADITLTTNTGIWLQYDTTASRWRAMGGTGSGGGGATAFTGLSDVPSSYSGQALKAVTVNAGETALVFTTISGGGNAQTANPLSQFAATTSAQLAGVISDETGTGLLVYGTGPTITLGNATGLPLATGVTGTLAAAQFPALTGDVTTSAGALATTLANIPVGATFAGGNVHSNVAAPSTPAAGKDSVYTDSTDLRLHDKNASGVIGTTVVADTGAANNFLTAVSAAGAISKAQPAFSNLSGSVASTQMPALTGDVTTSAGTVATTLAAGNAGNLNSGTLLAARMPALTGDATTSAGAVAVTVGKINGTALSGLATGILKNTTATGVPSIAASGTDYVAPSAYASSNGLTMATARLLGRTTASSGAAEEITVGSGLTLSAGSLTAAGGSGTVTHTVGGLIASALVVGNGSADIDVLASLGTTTTLLHGNAAGRPTFGAVNLAADVSGTLPGSAVGGAYTSSGMTMSTARILGRTTASTGAVEEITIGSGLSMTAGSLTATAGGGGTVTNTGGALTANSVMLGAGSADSKVVAGVTTDGTSVLNLGVAGTSVGKVAMANATSGTVTLAPTTGALGSAVLTLPALTDTLAVLGANQTFTGILTLSPTARSSGVAPYLSITIPADTGITAATEGPGFKSTSATRTWATTGTVALQREDYWAGPTYASASASQTFTDVFTGYFDKPTPGTNAIFTRPHTLGVVDSTSASSAITGGFVVATTLGTAATSVGIGGGNVNAGAAITAGSTVTAGTGLTVSSGASALKQTTVAGAAATTALTITQTARTSGVLPYIKWTIPTDTGQTAATESPGLQVVSGTRTWATTGTVALQRENYFAGPTYASASASQTFTDPFTAYFDKPIAGTNAIFTRPHTLGVVDSTSASSSITGGFIVATTLGTTATSVGIGGGNVNAGGNGTFGGTLAATGHTTFEGVTSTGATGTGNLVYDGSPTLTTPNLGTPSALTLTNATGLPGSQVTGAYTSAGLTMATARLLGRTTASSGAAEEITVGSGLSLSAGALTATGGGSGTVTNTGGNLTANALVLGAGTVDTKVAAGLTTDGTSKVTLGVAGTSVGSVDFKNATSGTLTIAPPTGALGTITTTLPNASSTLPIFGQQITFSGPTAARTVTLPDASFTAARTDAAQTFTGAQTFSTPVAIASGGTNAATALLARVALNQGSTTLSDAATIATDCSTGNVFVMTLITTGRAMGAPSNQVAGATYIWRIVQDGTGGRTLTWNSVFKWPGGTAPTITSAASSVDVISGVSDGTNVYCSFVQDCK